jgi:hypothetical protein
MGVLNPGSAHSDPPLGSSIDTSGKFPAHMSAESPSNISPYPIEVISPLMHEQGLMFRLAAKEYMK